MTETESDQSEIGKLVSRLRNVGDNYSATLVSDLAAECGNLAVHVEAMTNFASARESGLRIAREERDKARSILDRISTLMLEWEGREP